MTRPSEREMNTAVYLLRAKQLGLTLGELEEMDEGMVVDLIIESSNDTVKYEARASQGDMDRW